MSKRSNCEFRHDSRTEYDEDSSHDHLEEHPNDENFEISREKKKRLIHHSEPQDSIITPIDQNVVTSWDDAIGQLFVQLPCEIMFNIYKFLSVQDRAVKGLLYISKNITLQMLNINSIMSEDDLDSDETLRDERISCDSCEYYRLMVFLHHRKVIEDITDYATNRIIYLKCYENFNTTYNNVTNEWHRLKYSEKVRELGKEKSMFRYLIQNEPGLYSSSQIRFKLIKAIRTMNNLFPGWLTTYLQCDVKDDQKLDEIMQSNINLRNLRNVLACSRRVAIPVVSLDSSLDEDVRLEKTKREVIEILFEKQIRKRAKKQRNWKHVLTLFLKTRTVKTQIKEKLRTLAKKVLNAELFTGVKGRGAVHWDRSLTKHNIDLNSKEIVEKQFNFPKDFKETVEKVMQLLNTLDSKSRHFFMFRRDYAIGKNRHASQCYRYLQQNAGRNHTVKSVSNGFVSLYPRLIYLVKTIFANSEYQSPFYKQISMTTTRSNGRHFRSCMNSSLEQQTFSEVWNMDIIHPNSMMDFLNDLTEFFVNHWKEFCSEIYSSGVLTQVIDTDRFVVDFFVDGSFTCFRNIFLIHQCSWEEHLKIFQKLILSKYHSEFDKYGKVLVEIIENENDNNTTRELIQTLKTIPSPRRKYTSGKLRIFDKYYHVKEDSSEDYFPPIFHRRGRGRGRGGYY
ncbi:hypothetical protein C9374_012816 [Naegleria lovaniensis]|uniref:Uncharacterized protein n=1 Tax=Naegleria lovaniensis TaxID=51637 RepID=A0AA88KDN1_NAELO|nr:uncharacterized protein C9374_012816 [Naegleria lovaniensis]KAG2373084.1 hypothetical protein C9374_012816 [Naegleria lovaniensis]